MVTTRNGLATVANTNAAAKSLDSTDARSAGHRPQVNYCKLMKWQNLGVVARDGLEPPTPAFSGLRSTN